MCRVLKVTLSQILGIRYTSDKHVSPICCSCELDTDPNQLLYRVYPVMENLEKSWKLTPGFG